MVEWELSLWVFVCACKCERFLHKCLLINVTAWGHRLYFISWIYYTFVWNFSWGIFFVENHCGIRKKFYKKKSVENFDMKNTTTNTVNLCAKYCVAKHNEFRGKIWCSDDTSYNSFNMPNKMLVGVNSVNCLSASSQLNIDCYRCQMRCSLLSLNEIRYAMSVKIS